MTQQEYEQKKVDCWNELFAANPTRCDIDAFDAIFDRAYTLGKQEKDAEGEEMLTLPRKAIIQAYKISCAKRATKYDVGYADCLYNLFGSKCLPDNVDSLDSNVDSSEPKPAEPTANYVQVDYHGADTAASTIADSCQSQPVTDCHDFNHILKDGFRGHNRLHIAAQIVASMIGSDDWTTWRGGSNKEIWHNMAKSSLEIADALIAEAEKGGEA